MNTENSLYSSSVASPQQPNQTITFHDGTPQWVTSIPSSIDSTRMSAENDYTSLANFFRRPILVSTITWTPGAGAPLSLILDPWNAFFRNPRVANRATNYSFMRSKLHVKFMLNGNSFYYGRLMADYVPLKSFNDIDSLSPLQAENLIQASQRLHIMLDPSLSQGGEMILPFLYPYDHAGLTFDNQSTLGSLYLREINPLKHANGSATPVEITIFVWAEDVHLCVPTTQPITGLVAQADEYSNSTPISSVASSISAAASALTTIPWFAPYARATQMVSSSVGRVAKHFGYSRPVLLENRSPMIPYFNTPLANTDRGDNSTKLTVDSKQELSIDPTIFGIETDDELVITKMASIESYLTTFPWPVSFASGALLFNTRVRPMLHQTVSNKFYLPACAFASLPFQYWRGSIKYRFQIVASAYHKGRIKITFDPLALANAETNIVASRVVDLSTERDFTMVIGWANRSAFLPTIAPENPQLGFSTAASLAYNPTSNGVLTVTVLNSLTTPNDDVNNDIAINVFISMTDDADFAVPVTTNFENLTYRASSTGAAPAMALGGALESTEPTIDFQSEAYEKVTSTDNGAPVSSHCDDCINEALPIDHTHDVYFGEKITSFRQLLKRYVYHSSYNLGTSTTSTGNYELHIQDWPYDYGYYPSGYMVEPVTLATYNIATMTLLNLLTPAFVGVRGGLRSQYVREASGASQIGASMLVMRDAERVPYSVAVTAIPTTTQDLLARTLRSNRKGTYNGAEITQTSHNPVIQVEFPYYKPVRFSTAKSMVGAGSNDFDIKDSSHKLVMQNGANVPTYFSRYISIGEDFQLYLFNGAPPLAVLNLV